ncbi:MAG: cell division protein ZapA [Hyphomonadaceae bacterium]|jgi:cell division protein ZapA|nr:cell division protein ZapA [Hyphomonadaceae bacterium]
MGKVELEIHGRRYAIGCEDGQEGHIRRLAGHFGSKVAQLAAQVGEVGESRLFLMAALMIADELHEAQNQTAKADAEAVNREAGRRVARAFAETARAADLFDQASERLEKLAATIERA